VITPKLVHRYGFSVPEGCQSFCVGIQDLMDSTNSKTIQEMYVAFKKLSDTFTNAHAKCKYHDDMVFAAVFHELHLPLHQLSSDIIYSFQMVEGYGNDALHRISNNLEKDLDCAKAIWDTKELCPIIEKDNISIN
jgi:hypothetical protein